MKLSEAIERGLTNSFQAGKTIFNNEVSYLLPKAVDKYGIKFDLDKEILDKPPEIPIAKVNDSNDDSVKIQINGPITDDVEGGLMKMFLGEDVEYTSARMVKGPILEAGKKKKNISVRLNSPGGYTNQMAEIISALQEAKSNGSTIETIAEGIVASAAASIFLFGDNRLMSEYAELMYHRAWVNLNVIGNSNDIEKAARVAIESVSGFDEVLIKAIVKQTNLNQAEAEELVDNETWLNSNKAKDKGFSSGLAFDSESKDDSPSDVKALNRASNAIRASILTS